uniref:Anti-proliferative protein domain-containing protein n=1 Tax=Monodelphis domestica TaxID=13616 RepID=H9H6Z0_MONDO
MHLEIKVALNFIISYLYNKLPRRRADLFGEELERLLKKRYEGHWYPAQPLKGSGFRCVHIGETVDPVVELAAKRSGLAVDEVRANVPEELSVWIDPFEVSYQIGEKGSVKVLYLDDSEGGGAGGGAAAAELDKEIRSSFNPDAQVFVPIGSQDNSLSNSPSPSLGRSPSTTFITRSAQPITFTTGRGPGVWRWCQRPLPGEVALRGGPQLQPEHHAVPQPVLPARGPGQLTTRRGQGRPPPPKRERKGKKKGKIEIYKKISHLLPSGLSTRRRPAGRPPLPPWLAAWGLEGLDLGCPPCRASRTLPGEQAREGSPLGGQGWGSDPPELCPGLASTGRRRASLPRCLGRGASAKEKNLWKKEESLEPPSPLGPPPVPKKASHPEVACPVRRGAAGIPRRGGGAPFSLAKAQSAAFRPSCMLRKGAGSSAPARDQICTVSIVSDFFKFVLKA